MKNVTLTPEEFTEIKNSINASLKRIQEIANGQRPNRTKEIMTAKYIKACQQCGVEPKL